MIDSPKVLIDGITKDYYISERMRRGMDLSLTHPEALIWLHDTVSRMTPPVRVAEIGSWVGGATLVLADAVENAGGGCVYAIDNFSKFDGKEGPQPISDDVSFRFFENCRDEIDGRHIICDTRGSPAAAERFPDGWLDLVFIDGAHNYDSVCVDIAEWDYKVRDGGIICGHDFTGESDGVGRAVRNMYNNEFKLYLGDLWVMKLERL